MNLDAEKFPCPCCGHLVHDFAPGHHQSCPICGWEDNLVQLRFPLMPGSCNTVSLAQGQRNFCEYGAAERRYIGKTREPEAGDRKEREWRPLDPKRDNIEEPRRGQNYADTYPYENTAVLYYWRPTYWRRLVS